VDVAPALTGDTASMPMPSRARRAGMRMIPFNEASFWDNGTECLLGVWRGCVCRITLQRVPGSFRMEAVGLFGGEVADKIQ